MCGAGESRNKCFFSGVYAPLSIDICYYWRIFDASERPAMSASYVFEALKAHYRARGLTYRDVALSLKLSEATVKRIFSARDCTLARLEQLCAVAQVELADVARGGPRNQNLLTRLTEKQEQEIVNDIKLLIVAVCAMGNMRFEQIVESYAITKAQCVALLARLDKIGFLELQPNNTQIRRNLIVAQGFMGQRENQKLQLDILAKQETGNRRQGTGDRAAQSGR